MRELGIPTVLDRFIRQASPQVLQSEQDRSYSQLSYGFRAGKRGHQAVCAAQTYVREGVAARWRRIWRSSLTASTTAY
jgi:RNA-directed DNA polymerase